MSTQWEEGSGGSVIHAWKNVYEARSAVVHEPAPGVLHVKIYVDRTTRCAIVASGVRAGQINRDLVAETFPPERWFWIEHPVIDP